MSEYELVDVMASLQNNLIQGQAVTITMLSAYMVVAYTVGKKLTTFQCTFVSLMFLLFGLFAAAGQVSNMNEMYYYGPQLGELRGGQYLGVDADSAGEEVARWLFVLIRVLLFGGALYFMWSVRHPKPE
jgi:hypothetical protein